MMKGVANTSNPLATTAGRAVGWLALIVGIASHAIAVSLMMQHPLGGPGIDFQDLGTLATPWIRQMAVPLAIVLTVQLVLISALGWWRPVLFDSTRDRRWWVAAIATLPLLLGLSAVVRNGLADAPSSYFVGLTVTVLLVGVTEELTFRGVVLVAVRRLRTTERAALWISVTAFGLFHLGNLLLGAEIAVTLRQVVQTTLIGAILYCARRSSSTILLPIAIHAAYDWLVLQSLF